MTREELLERLRRALAGSGDASREIAALIREVSLDRAVYHPDTGPTDRPTIVAPGITDCQRLDNGLLMCAWDNERAKWSGYINPTNEPLITVSGHLVRPRGMIVRQSRRNYPTLPCHDLVPDFALKAARTPHPRTNEFHPDHRWWPEWKGGLSGSHGGWAVAPYVQWRTHPELVDQCVSELIGMAQRQDRLDPLQETTGFDKEFWWGAEQSPFDVGPVDHTVPELSHYMRNIRAALALAALGDPFAQWYLGQCMWQQTWWMDNEPWDATNPASYNLHQMAATTGYQANRHQGRHIAHLLYLCAGVMRWGHNQDIARTTAETVIQWLDRTRRPNGTNHLDNTGCRVWEERLVKCGVQLCDGTLSTNWRFWNTGNVLLPDPYSCPPLASTCNGVNPNGQDFGKWYRSLTFVRRMYFDTETNTYKDVNKKNLESYATPHSLDATEMLDSVPALGAY